MEPILEVSDLSVRYRTVSGDNTAVDRADLTVNRGEIMGIAGESGCGKSTMATTILRLLRAPGYVSGGSVTFHPNAGDPIDLLTVDDRHLRAIRWSKLSYLPQGSMNSLNPVMRVRDQFFDILQAPLGGDRPAMEGKVANLLGQVGLDTSVAHMYAHELSGGMKQRVIMALAVALEPDLLIADEPTTALDVTIQRVVIQNLAELRDRYGLAMIVITHDMGVHAQLADRVAVMYEGRVVEVGSVRQIFKAPKHEYTAKLIRSIPTLDVDQRKIVPVPVRATNGIKQLGLERVVQLFPGRAGLKVRAVNDVSLDLRSEPAQIISLVGASGSGKSTVARMLLGLQKPSGGRVTYNGKDVSKLAPSEYDAFRKDVQPVFQDPYSIFNPFYRVDRVFWKAIKKFGLAQGRAAGLGLIEDSLKAVRLNPDAVLGRFPHQLSGGQRQRLMLARVYMLRPSFIIADEPVSMLDAQVRRTFLDVLVSFQEEYHMTTLFITHDLSTVAYLGGQMMTMFQGAIVEQGSVKQVLTQPSHDYTKLLLASVPDADPDKRWQDRVELVDGKPRIVAARPYAETVRPTDTTAN